MKISPVGSGVNFGTRFARGGLQSVASPPCYRGSTQPTLSVVACFYSINTTIVARVGAIVQPDFLPIRVRYCVTANT